LNNLRSALSRLRSTLGDRGSEPHFLLVSRDTIQFNTASDYWLDVTEFERHMADCERLGAGSRLQSEIQELESAIELYHGPFLEGFSLKGSPPFEEWALLKREEIDRQLLCALHRLATLHERRGEYGQAEAYARRQLDVEPWSEEAHRQLMRLLALSGQRSAALAQYEACRRLLAHELGVDPEPETTALYESIREGEYAEGQQEWAGEQPQPSAYALPSAAPPFVDREAELAKLDRLLDLALAGQGQAAFVTGDAGSGKTALLAEFARRAMERHGDVVVAASHCSAYGGIGDPYLPFREIVQMLSGDVEAQRAGGAISGAHSRRLRALLPAAVQALIESGPDLIDRFVPAAALALRVEAFSPWPGGAAVRAACRAHLLDPARRVATSDPLPATQHLAGKIESRSGAEGMQAGLFAQVTRVLQVLARHRALILVVDDLQWADPGSVSLLFHLGHRLAGSRILLIGAYRPDDVALGRDGERHPLEQVVGELQRDGGDILVDLSQADGRQIVDAMCDAEVNRLGVAFRETLYRHTAGNPLFTIELLRGLQERGELVRDQAGQWIEGPVLHWEQLPPRVEAAVAERIGRLPAAEQAILAAASVEGDEFTAEVVAHVLGLDQRQITHKLSGPLSQQQLVHAQGRQRLGPDGQRLSRYRFHHHLFQAYVYQRLDEVQRAELHEAVGRALETLYGEQAAEVAAKLAWHFEAAGLAEKAVSYLLQAGNRAMRLAAREEAIALLNQGLVLLQTLPASSAHARQELSLQLSLGAALLAGRGWGAPERGGALDRALVLSQSTDVGGPRQVFSTLSGFISYYVGRGESRAAHDLAEQLLSLAQQTQDPAYMAVAHGLLGATWLNLGEIITGRSHFEQAIALYDAQQAGSPDSQALMETGAARRAWLGLALWALGYPDQALVRSQEALAEARGLGDALTLAFVLALGVALHILRRESVAAQS
ncbi:MAG: AAA family ATPase, partial [Anaerolineae bacterium]|nr:AAA family ATPase [Anaerolineae bacterium]